MKKIRLKYYLILVATVVVVMGILYNTIFISDTRQDGEVLAAINKFSTTTPSDFDILFKEKIDDDRENLKIFSFTLFSKENITVTKSTPLRVKASTALKVMKVNLKSYNFSEPIESNAISYRWRDKKDQWSMTILKTSDGFYSHWEMLGKL